MGNAIKINENTWRIEDTGVRFLLLCGTQKAALIDTGMNLIGGDSIQNVPPKEKRCVLSAWR